VQVQETNRESFRLAVRAEQSHKERPARAVPRAPSPAYAQPGTPGRRPQLPARRSATLHPPPRDRAAPPAPRPSAGGCEGWQPSCQATSWGKAILSMMASRIKEVVFQSFRFISPVPRMVGIARKERRRRDANRKLSLILSVRHRP